MNNYWPYIGIFFLLLLSAFFSGSETAYNSINRQRLRREAESGKTGAKLAEKIYDKYDETGLTTILVGNTLVNLSSCDPSTNYTPQSNHDNTDAHGTVHSPAAQDCSSL